MPLTRRGDRNGKRKSHPVMESDSENEPEIMEDVAPVLSNTDEVDDNSHHCTHSSSSRPVPISPNDDNSHFQDIKPMIFSQLPRLEQSQTVPLPRSTEVRNLNNLNPTTRERAITVLSRLLLFKGLAREPIDRRKCVNEALSDLKEERTSNAVFHEAVKRLVDVFGFDVCGIPSYMEDNLPSKYKDRFYVVNKSLDSDGTHSRHLHDNDGCGERALLMVVLAFAYCKGSMKNDGKDHTNRWISESMLYELLHEVDDNIPVSPAGRRRRHHHEGFDVDDLLETFVRMDYLLKEKIEKGEDGRMFTDGTDDDVFVYAMGPRAALEIGRRQLVYFCAEILDEQPDPTMLSEIDDEKTEEVEEGGEV